MYDFNGTLYEFLPTIDNLEIRKITWVSKMFVCLQDIFVADSNLRSSDVELQQRASEYLALSKITRLVWFYSSNKLS